MQNEKRQFWLSIAVAALGVILGAVALVVALDAKSASDDAPSIEAVSEVAADLSQLRNRLGISEGSLSGGQTSQGKAVQAARLSSNAIANLTKRMNYLEAHREAAEVSEQQVARLVRQFHAIEGEIEELSAQASGG